MSNLKTKFNGKTLCVFANIDKDIQVHLANIDTMANRIYTTPDGYDLISTNEFKKDHPLTFFDENSKTEYRKFSGIVVFRQNEIQQVIRMCSRALAI